MAKELLRGTIRRLFQQMNGQSFNVELLGRYQMIYKLLQ